MQHNSLTVTQQLESAIATPFSSNSDWSAEDYSFVLQRLILSASGWRTVFAEGGDEHDFTPLIGEPYRLLACFAADAFGAFIGRQFDRPARVAVATDARPTGKLIAAITVRALLAREHTPEYLGIAPTPQLLAYSAMNPDLDAFICITASHNPIGHNGFKFGLNDGGVLSVAQAQTLTARLRELLGSSAERSAAVRRAAAVPFEAVGSALAAEHRYHAASARAYREQALRLLDPGNRRTAERLRAACRSTPLAVLGELNGSARGRSIDREVLEELGCGVELLNAEPGEVVHQIVPEGPGLEDCRAALAERAGDPSGFLLGYVPDNDGDRGNLVYRALAETQAFALGAQDVFALACFGVLSELSAQTSAESDAQPRTAVVVNGPTSLRIEEIAERFGAEVYRAEVGEANVLALADRLTADGYTVPIIGEGSNGGAIIPPQRVRDPLTMLLTVIKLLRLTDTEGGAARDVPAVLTELPRWVTTSAYDPEALLRLNTGSHEVLKRRYEERFLTRWSREQRWFRDKLGAVAYEEHNYEGTHDRVGLGPESRSGEHDGGLKLLFRDAAGVPVASVWMRGSKTEPIMRIMAEVRGSDEHAARELLKLQRELVLSADR